MGIGVCPRVEGLGCGRGDVGGGVTPVASASVSAASSSISTGLLLLFLVTLVSLAVLFVLRHSYKVDAAAVVGSRMVRGKGNWTERVGVQMMVRGKLNEALCTNLCPGWMGG